MRFFVLVLFAFKMPHLKSYDWSVFLTWKITLKFICHFLFSFSISLQVTLIFKYGRQDSIKPRFHLCENQTLVFSWIKLIFFLKLPTVTYREENYNEYIEYTYNSISIHPYMNIVSIRSHYQFTMLQCEGNILVILSSWFPFINSDRKINYELHCKTYKTE